LKSHWNCEEKIKKIKEKIKHFSGYLESSLKVIQRGFTALSQPNEDEISSLCKLIQIQINPKIISISREVVVDSTRSGD